MLFEVRPRSGVYGFEVLRPKPTTQSTDLSRHYILLALYEHARISCCDLQAAMHCSAAVGMLNGAGCALTESSYVRLSIPELEPVYQKVILPGYRV